jgi:hypothetical protein
VILLDNERSAALFTYVAPDGGYCAALPRFNELPIQGAIPAWAVLNPVGVICTSADSSQACFWDYKNIASFPAPIEDAIAGNNPNSEPCTECHQDANPFIASETPPLSVLPGDANEDDCYTAIGGTIASDGEPWPTRPRPGSPASPPRTACGGCHETEPNTLLLNLEGCRIIQGITTHAGMMPTDGGSPRDVAEWDDIVTQCCTLRVQVDPTRVCQ